MKPKFSLWITPLKTGEFEIIIHEMEWRNDGGGKISGFVNHRWITDMPLDPR